MLAVALMFALFPAAALAAGGPSRHHGHDEAQARPPSGSFNASFEGGNFDPQSTRWTGPNTIAYKGLVKCGPASTKCSPYTNWVYFHVANLSTTEATTLVPLSSDWPSPPWFSYTDAEDGADWARVAAPASASASAGARPEAGPPPRFTHHFARPGAFLAFSVPYVPGRQRRKLIADLVVAAAPSSGAQQMSIATSEAGNDVAALNISARGGARGKRALVWFQARQHAWESGSSWVADGLARFAASPRGGALRRLADVVVVPIMDVDNVVVGGAGKDQLPVDFNRDWCALGQVARNETGALCQHWNAIRAAVAAIRDAMASGRYGNLIFVDSHSPGNPEDPAQVWTECATGPTAVAPRAWNLTQGYKVALEARSLGCGRLAYRQWCAEVGPAYGNRYSGYHASEISFMDVFYRQHAAIMNAPGTRSMSFSHETSAATVGEAHCYGAAIGESLAALLAAPPGAPVNTTGASTTCTGYADTCHARPAGPPGPPGPPGHSGYVASGAGSADANGRYSPDRHSRSNNGVASWSNGKHTIYRYDGRWHISDVFGVNVYYDAPGATGEARPPLVGWRANYTWHIDGRNYTGLGVAPAPTLAVHGRA